MRRSVFNIILWLLSDLDLIESVPRKYIKKSIIDRYALTGKVEGKRDRGKQRITFLDSLCNSATGGQSKGLNFLKFSDDRDVWRGMVANVCSRSGT